MHSSVIVSFFFFTAPAPPEIYTLSLHDALPIYLPGTQIAAFLNRPYSGTPPDFEIRWTPISIFPSSGTYWVSVQAVQDFNPNGQWFWHNRTVQSNAGASWQNPGNGYGTGCTSWNRKNACLPDQVWPDQVFQIFGFLREIRRVQRRLRHNPVTAGPRVLTCQVPASAWLASTSTQS